MLHIWNIYDKRILETPKTLWNTRSTNAVIKIGWRVVLISFHHSFGCACFLDSALSIMRKVHKTRGVWWMATLERPLLMMISNTIWNLLPSSKLCSQWFCFYSSDVEHAHKIGMADSPLIPKGNWQLLKKRQEFGAWFQMGALHESMVRKNGMHHILFTMSL